MRKEFRPEKQRHEIAVQRFASPLRDAVPRSLEYFWQNRHIYDRASNVQWEDGGPCNFSGRATCLVIGHNQPNLLYAGSAAGGLWKSVDGGDSWASCWPNALSQNIGAVAVDPLNPDCIICATGEGNISTASYPGSGIYQSEDCGFTWRSFIFVPTHRRITPEDRDTMPRRVSSISFSAASQSGGTRIAFGTISNDEQLLGGLYVDTDPGFGLKFVTRWSNRPYNCHSAVFHPTEPLTLYAGIEAGGSLNGIWRSKDAGATWEQLAGGLPSGELCGRISLAISRKDPSVIWAMISSRGRKVLGVFCSLDGGQSWKNKAGSDFDDEGQLAYNNSIAIHPENPRIVICGAQNLLRTTDGGRHWRPITQKNRAINSTKRNRRYVHPDHHAVVMAGGNLVYSANDGGIARSKDLGDTWEPASHGMSTVMFYAIDVSPANARIYGGGAQDNGTLMAGVNAGYGLNRKKKYALQFTQVLDGDGGYLVCDAKEEELVFGSTFSTETYCHHPGRRWARGLLLSNWRNASPKVSPDEKDVLGLTVMAIRPATKHNRRELLLGTNRLWRSRNDGRSWRPSLYQFDGSAITAIEIAHANPSIMYIGTARGGIFRSDDGGHNWSADLAGPEIPNRVITQVETDPRDAAVVVATVAATTRESVTLDGGPKSYSHVFRSSNAGALWEDIDRGKLPNVVFNGLAFETHPPYRIFVAGDAGPWVLDRSGKWVSIAGDMPSAVISDIVYHHKTKTLTAGTYGRGIWRMKVPDKFGVTPAEPGIDANSLVPPIEGFTLDRRVPVPVPLSPADGASLQLSSGLTPFTCSPVPGAIGYTFEAVGPRAFSTAKSSPSPAVEMRIQDNGDHVWTCWALTYGGLCSFPSAARKFTCST